MSQTLLGGRVIHAQPAQGHRTGIEPVLLAASIAARPGAHVLEGGTGSGAALLCLAARVPGLTGLGIERLPAAAAIARANIAANGFAGLAVSEGDLTTLRPAGPFDHAFANPPWHLEHGTASPDAARDLARRGAPDLLARWAAALAAPLRRRGSLTLVLPAGLLADGLAALAAAGCGSFAVLPLWPHAGQPAGLLLLRGIKAGRGPTRLLAGLVLHEPAGGYSAAAGQVLRDAAALPWH